MTLDHALRRLGPLALAVSIAGAALCSASPPSLADTDPWRLCADQAAEVQGDRDLPPFLLHAIARVESGRWNGRQGAVSAWPWTVMAEGKGLFLPSKAAAIAQVRSLQARGLRNIDVGCMQINLRYHPDAFAGLEEAFEPASNIAYAADLLRRLRKKGGSWTKAVALYHSSKPAFNGPYRLKVFRAWREERRRADHERRAGIVVAAGQSAAP